MRRFASHFLLTAATLAAGPAASQPGTCAVPGSHPTIRAAIDDAQCAQIDLAAQTHAESIDLPRSLSLAGPAAGGAVLEGGVEATAPSTQSLLADLEVRNGCPQAALSVASGAQVAGRNLVVMRAAGSPCPSAAVIFADGFESGDTSAWSTTVP